MELNNFAVKYREEADLGPTKEDTMEIAKHMRASSPPTSAADILEAQGQKKNNRPFRRVLNLTCYD